MFTFNGFSQLGQIGQKVLSSKAFQQHFLADKREIKLAASWSYTAFATDNKLALYGFLARKAFAEILHLNVEAKIAEIAAADKYCLILLETGKVLKLRTNENADFEEVKYEIAASTPWHASASKKRRKVCGQVEEKEEQSTVQIAHIACGMAISVALSNKNVVYSGTSQVFQFAPEMRIKQLVCGWEHALLLSEACICYAWGSGIRGQLGLDELQLAQEQPVVIDALAGIRIICIAAGGASSAAISDFGDLYVWGCNRHSQLGLKMLRPNGNNVFHSYHLPELIDFPDCLIRTNDDANIKRKEHNSQEFESTVELGSTVCSKLQQHAPCKIFLGARHAIVLMSCGEVFAAGSNYYKQIDSTAKRNVIYEKFTKIFVEPESGLHLNIFCANWCTIFQREAAVQEI